MGIRRADFAGSWYPGEPSACEKEIKQFLKEYDTETPEQKEIRGGIVPHAGWYYSGSIACNIIECLQHKTTPDVIAVFGMHLGKNSPGYIMTSGEWETPFGSLVIHDELASKLQDRLGFIVETAEHYSQDNTIELQLPFIKYFFKDVQIIPIGVPPSEIAIEAGDVLVEAAEGIGCNLKVLGSTDLTHYGFNYGFTPQGSGEAAHEWSRNENDRKVIDAMLAMDSRGVIKEAMENKNACCAGAAAAAVSAAKRLGADKAEKIAYATSYEKNPGDSFVGYVGIVF